MVYLDSVEIENAERGSLTRMMVCAGRTVVGMTVRHKSLLKDTREKKWRPLGEGSLTGITVMQDGPSQGRRSVTYVQ